MSTHLAGTQSNQSSQSFLGLLTVDILTIWFLLLLGIGHSEVCRRKVNPFSISLSYFGLWAFWILGKMGWAAVVTS